MRRLRRTLRVETLEARQMLCAEHLLAAGLSAAWLDAPADAPTAASVPIPPEGLPPVVLGPEPVRVAGPAASPPPTAANGLPLLESFPGAPVSLYLDFDGFTGNGYGGQQTHNPYSVDGDGTTYNAQEQTNIIEGWRRVAAHFAPFDVNVTTIVPNVPKTWTVITPSFGGPGYSWGQFNGFAPSSFNPQGDLLSRTTGLLHEIGHDFGLAHQSEYDLLGNRTKEYRNGYDSLHGPIMGVDYDGSVPKWYIGHSTNSPSALQDDVAVIAAKIRQYQPPGGDGFRADDHGNTIATATVLDSDAGVQASYGIIERLTDRDVFAFAADGGEVSIDATRDSLSGVDMKMELFAADGTLLAASDTTPNDQHLVVSLAAGTYYAAVSSHGDYSDIGPYNLTVQSLPAGWRHQDVGNTGQAGYVRYDAATETFGVGGSGTRIDSTSDSFHFAYQTLRGDGEIIARVTAVENTNSSAKAGVMIRQSLANNSPHAFVLATPSSGSWLRSRATTGGDSSDSPRTAEPFAPIWVRLVRSGDTLTGYTSDDGAAWTLEDSATIANLPTDVFIGLATTATNNNVVNDSTYTNVSIVGDVGVPPEVVNSLSAPANLTVTNTTSTRVELAWDAVSGATGYTIERSSDGTAFTQVGTTNAGTTTYSNSGLTNFQRYFYRVRANDAAGVSVASDVTSGLTRGGAVTSFAVTSWTETQLILNWRDRSGESGYRVERSTDGTNFSTIATVGINFPSYTDSGLTPGGTYTYRVVTLDAQGDAATSSTASSSTRLSAPSGFTLAEIAADHITLSWTDVNGESDYILERSTNGVDFSTLATLPAGSASYRDDAVAPLGEYYYRLQGRNGSIPGAVSSTQFAGTPSVDPLTAPWTAADLGNVSGSGVAGFANGAFGGGALGGEFTLISAGTDLSGTTDSLHFVRQALVGDGTIIARLSSLESTDDTAEVGLMVRETLNNNSKSFAVVSSPSGGAHLRYRTSTGGSSATSGSGLAGPQWFKLTRAGNLFTAYTSTDGSSWAQLGNATTISMSETVFVGLASTSGDGDLLNTSTFDNVFVGFDGPIALRVGYSVDEDGVLVTGDPITLAVPLGATWKYLDDGSNQGTTWRGRTFDDSAWLAGAAPLGYGDGGLGTTVASTDAGANPIVTTYFRRTFPVADAAEVTDLFIQLMRDDGAAVFLNGVEIVRSNLDDPAAFDTLANDTIGGADETALNPFTVRIADLPAGTLREGTNVLAVEIHQESTTSSDIRFDLQLALGRPADPPVLFNDVNFGAGATVAVVDPPANGTALLGSDGSLTYTPGGDFFGIDSLTYRITTPTTVILPATSRWKYLDNGSNQAAAWRAVAFDDSSWASGPAELGYGDGDEQTIVASGPSNNHFATTYFRRTIDLPDGVAASELSMRLRRDDAAAVYVNGVEVYRDANLAAGAAYNEYATSSIPSAEENNFITVSLPGHALVSGANVIAVEVHQGSAGSSDLSFALELSGRYTSVPATVTFTVEPTPDLPVAADDAYDASGGQALTVAAPGVLANDNDADGDLLGTVVRTLPTSGTLALSNDGSFTYTPNAGFAGQDAFTYAASDDTVAELVEQGSDWRYLDDGIDPGVNWRSLGFADAAWPVGPAQLGYGDGDEATVVDCGPSAPACGADNRATTYFRRTFSVPDAGRVDMLELFLLRDDAAAVYLNGVEVFRDANLAAGAGHSTYATSASDDNAAITLSIDAALLVDGTNVLAVEVHQASAGSSDISFDLGLTGRALSNVATVTIDVASTATPGDFNADDRVDVTDLDLLLAALQGGSTDLLYDVTGDHLVTPADLDRVVFELVETSAGVGTRYGDVDLDGDVDRHDAALLSLQFGRSGAATWSGGDWNASGATDLADLATLQANLGFAPPPGGSPAAANAVVAATSASKGRAAKVSAAATHRAIRVAAAQSSHAVDALSALSARPASRRTVRFAAHAQAVDAAVAAADLDGRTHRPGRVRRSAESPNSI